MTHTVADAEAAIARHPESLEQLSMAADLMQELGDPRGEDFSLCLQGLIDAEELMRRHPACRHAMFVAAWAMDTAACSRCGGTGQRNTHVGGYDWEEKDCERCHPVKAEALRLLAECGKVGSVGGTDGYYYWSISDRADSERVCDDWWIAARGRNRHFMSRFMQGIIPARLALLDAYAEADPETRRRWADGTRALTPLDFVPFTLSAADSEFLATLESLSKTVRTGVIQGLGVPPDVFQGGSYINTPGDGR